MDLTVKAITALLVKNSPDTFCSRCLAIKLHIVQYEIRRAAQALVLLPKFQLTRRNCARCGREDNLLQTLTR
jgi:hypothetical protein